MQIDEFEAGKTILKPVHCWFSDVDPPRKLNIWESSSTFIIFTRRARHIQNSQWIMTRISLSHIQCGGVTDGSWDFMVYSPLASITLDPPSSVAGRDLSSILNNMKDGLPCAAPTISYLDKLKVVKLRPGVYHGGGILPWHERNCSVLTQSVFSDSGWCRRKIQGEEMMHVLDVPEDMISDLSSSQRRTLCADCRMIPLAGCDRQCLCRSIVKA